MEVQYTKDDLERAGTFLDKRVNLCLEELRNVEEKGTSSVNSILEQEIQSTRHELRTVSLHLNEKIDASNNWKDLLQSK